MLCRDIMKVIETTYPRHAALEWDNVGLLVGRTEKEVHTIYVALDATDEVIADAISQGVDMLITHHPLLFSPLKKITDEHFIGSRVVKLLQHDISYYAMHTNYDVLGMAEKSGAILGLIDMEVLEMTDENSQKGIGKVGYLPEEMTVAEISKLIKKKYSLDAVKVFGDLKKKARRIAISPGSGKHMSELALTKGAEVFVTGDIDHHEGIDAVAQGLVIIDAGHYGLEHVFIAEIAQFIHEKFPNVKVIETESKHPFQIV